METYQISHYCTSLQRTNPAKPLSQSGKKKVSDMHLPIERALL